MTSAELNRLRWRCRRGMLELDVLLTRFVDAHHAQLSAETAVALDALLDQSDGELWAMLSGITAPPAPLLSLVTRIRTVRCN